VLKKANEELNDIKAEIRKEGKDFEPMGWDWSYYSNKAKQAKYAMDENELRPYLKLENVRDGMFLLANKLYGVTFSQIDSIPVPHPEATAFECKDADGTHLGVLYLDFFPRASKRGGAWCGRYRNQTYVDGQRKAPVVTVVCNFSKPAAGQPSLLTADEASTMFHEFGHALHSLFADVHYYGVASVPRDFVELPSQVMEHWVFEPEMLALYAKHYETGEVMPTALVEKLEKSGKYGQGFATAEYWAAAWLDMEFHLLNELPEGFEVMAFEKQIMDKIKMPKQIAPRYRTTYFNHTMGGGYTAGYYSYFWSEVLDADAYEAFKETGDIFNKDVAAKFRECVLTPGCIEDADVMYHNFRGATPSIEPVLKNRGLK
jgi:peptidyl-dipeptidase Dcp